MSIIRADQAPTFELPGVRFTAYAAPSRGSAELCTWQITVAPDQEPASHTLDRDETFLVLEGRLRVTPDGEDLGPGDVVVVPAGETIAVVNPGLCPRAGLRGDRRRLHRDDPRRPDAPAPVGAMSRARPSRASVTTLTAGVRLLRVSR